MALDETSIRELQMNIEMLNAGSLAILNQEFNRKETNIPGIVMVDFDKSTIEIKKYTLEQGQEISKQDPKNATGLIKLNGHFMGLGYNNAFVLPVLEGLKQQGYLLVGCTFQPPSLAHQSSIFFQYHLNGPFPTFSALGSEKDKFMELILESLHWTDAQIIVFDDMERVRAGFLENRQLPYVLAMNASDEDLWRAMYQELRGL